MIIKKTLPSLTLYGLSLAVLAALMTWAKYRFLLFDHVWEIYGLIIAIIFVGVGIWMGLKLSRPKTIVRQEIVIREIPLQDPATLSHDPQLLAQLNKQPGAGSASVAGTRQKQ